MRERVKHRWLGPVAARIPGHRGDETRPAEGLAPPVAFPADVADRAALVAHLRQTDVFGTATREADGYLGNSVERFRITMAMLPELSSDARILELGANPYFLTRLLRERGLTVVCANWFGEAWAEAGSNRQTVTEGGSPTTYEFAHFNMERDPFPFADDSFDLVLFCEILEHLPVDPVHPLAEIHRVLKPGGLMLLTTPNAARWDNVARMLRGDNVFGPLSGYGVYGRHNREYTQGEVEDLLSRCGYEILTSFDADITPQPDPPEVPSGARARGRAENLFVLARSEGPTRWRYPTWLFASAHALSRCVRPDLIVGVNCDLQSKGLHDIETFEHGRAGRWTSGEPARVLLCADQPGLHRITVEGIAAPPAAGGTITLTVTAEDASLSWTVPCDGKPFEVTGEMHLNAGPRNVTVSTDRTWRPCDVTGSVDARQLGVILSAVRIAPPTAPDASPAGAS
jgi:SAM-dependent methyltransferase